MEAVLESSNHNQTFTDLTSRRLGRESSSSPCRGEEDEVIVDKTRPRLRFLRSLGLLLIQIFLLVFPFRLFAQGIPPPIEYVSPIAGSNLVSPQTNLILRSRDLLARLIPSDLPVFSVSGSSSGMHSGTTVVSDDRRTVIFTPNQPFVSDETVTVKVQWRARTPAGDRIEPFEFKFIVSPRSNLDRDALMRKISADPSQTAAQMGDPGARHSGHLMKAQGDSIPTDFPPRLIVVSNNPEPGGLFLATFKIAEASDHLAFISYVPSDEQYLMVLDRSVQPVFYRKMPAMSTDFKLQPNGFLTFYDDARGAYYEIDSNYVVVDSFRCGNGYRTNLHELILLPNGHALMLGDDRQMIDMSKIVSGGNPNAMVIGAVIQELDREKRVIFEWRSFDHFKITDAVHEDFTAGAVDYVHPNTIEVDTDGNLLLSSRHMDEITKIDRHTGNIIWRWGGKNNQFTFINDTPRFSHQHTIRRTPTGTLILFDNGNYRAAPSSRAVEYQVNESAKTAKLIWQFRHSPDVKSIAMGSVQRLADGMTIIGWGTGSPALTEVRPDGSVALEVGLPDSLVSYRALLYPWNQSTIVSGIREDKPIPQAFSLDQNYPNPFNPTTRIQFGLPRRTRMSLKVYDMLGRVVATLVEGEKMAGNYSVQFDGGRFPSGTYLYRLITPERSITRTMILMK
jgi:hypothetical protein